MDGNELVKKQDADIIPAHQELAILQALTLYLSGQSTLTEALSSTPNISKGTYYNLKQDYPGEILLIEQKAKRAATAIRSAAEMRFEASHLEQSQDIRKVAVDAMMAAIPMMRDIATGEPRTAERIIMVKGEPTHIQQIINPYPRDQISAFNALKELAQQGFIDTRYLPSERIVHVDEKDDKEAEDDSGGLLPLFSIGSQFSRVTAEKPDGTKFTATVEKPDLIEGEVTEK